MDNITLNPKGSLWRKWDLHVHTPASIENQYEGANNEEKWQRFIGDIEQLPPEFKVIGINDYFFIDGYRRVLHEWKDNSRMQNIALFLPVIEFRIRKFCGHKEWNRINYHVIFSDELSPEVIQQQFLNSLSSKYALDPEATGVTWQGVITPESVMDLGSKIIKSVPLQERGNYGSTLKEGFNNLNIDDNALHDALVNNTFLQGKYITAIGKAEWDKINWADNSIAEKKTVINTADVIFCASEDVPSFERAKRKLTKAGVKDLLLDCSDSHHNLNSEDKDRLGNCNTWIKADTTFEGLKQILYEPNDRVCVSELPPDVKDSYQVIDKVILNEDGFWQQEINLNPNLNTIIGGRSTGKSTLLSCVANRLHSYTARRQDNDSNDSEEERDFVVSHTDGVTVQWRDGETDSMRKIEFFPQDHMYSIAKDKNKRNKLLETILLGVPRLSELKTSNEDTINSIKREIGELINLLFELLNKGRQQRAKLKSLGDAKGMQNEITQLNKEIQRTEKTLKIDRAKIEQYNNVQKQVTLFEKQFQVLGQQNNQLTKLITNEYFIVNPSLDMSSIEEDSRKVLTEWIQTNMIRANTAVRQKINELNNGVTKQIASIQKQRTDLMNSQIYRESVEFQKGNQKYKVLQDKLKLQNEKLATYKRELAVFKEVGNNYKETFEKLTSKFVSFQSETKKIADFFNIQHDGIVIKGLIDGKSAALRSRLESMIDQRSSQAKETINHVCDSVKGDYPLIEAISELINNILKNNVTLRGNVTQQMALSSILTENWFGVNYSTTYDGDDFDGMSRGKQAFVILKLLLDFSENKCPILIDQPEDSLDNRAIYTDLVTYLKRKKKERQIILVTHNANVVVGADSELVIIANQQGNTTPNKNGLKFQYLGGSLENTFVATETTKDTPVLERCGIREHVCDIVEGGKEAFVKRERKYGFKG